MNNVQSIVIMCIDIFALCIFVVFFWIIECMKRKQKMRTSLHFGAISGKVNFWLVSIRKRSIFSKEEIDFPSDLIYFSRFYALR